MSLHVDDLPEDLDDLEVNVDIETLAGDLRDAMLTRYKQLPALWSHMTQEQQNMLAEGTGHDARRLVEEAVKAVTSYEFPRAVGKIAKMTVIPGDKARIECPIQFQLTPENLQVLGTEVGSMVAVLMVDSSTFKGEKAPVQTDPDQPDLPMGDGEDDGVSDMPVEADTDEEIDPLDLGVPLPGSEPVDSDEVAAAQAAIAQEATEFEASAAELAEQKPRRKVREARREQPEAAA